MKKIWMLLCVALLCVAILAACGEKEPEKVPDDGTPEVTTVTEEKGTVTTSGNNEDVTTKKTEQTTTTAPAPGGDDGEPNPAFVDDRPNGNNTKPDTFTD